MVRGQLARSQKPCSHPEKNTGSDWWVLLLKREPEWAHRGEFSPELAFDALGLVSPLLCAGEEHKALLVLPVSSHWCWSRISGACRTTARALHRLNSLLTLCPSFPTIQLVMWKLSVFKRSRISADFGLDFCWRGFFHLKTLLKVRHDFCRRFCMGRFLHAYSTCKQQPMQESRSTEGEREMALHVYCKTYINIIHPFETQSLSDLPC